MERNLVLLGSTGSIGRQTLDVVRNAADPIRVYGLAANSNVRLLADQAAEFRPQVVVAGPEKRSELDGAAPESLEGEVGMVELCSRPEVDLVVVATAGLAGLMPTLAALRAGKLVALANKETLVAAGPIIRRDVELSRGELVPIDSEHSAIWQCLQGEPHSAIERLILTASGGALRHLDTDQLAGVTPQQALAHPTWQMGKKITIDSATLMNKGLEVIEARWLFDLPIDRIDVIMHCESIIHSLVNFRDGSTKAQLGLPDMRLPIQYALSHPGRWPNNLERLNLASVASLHFGRVDLERYPCLALALRAGAEGGTYPAVLCAADEEAVDLFLAGAISFTRIPEIVEDALTRHTCCSSPELGDILEASRWARWTAHRLVAT
ncbi:MAG TPA: 1-deoxy-D-xylulose-5-phosphate reductoisomerase [Chloroflexota bacterium]